MDTDLKLRTEEGVVCFRVTTANGQVTIKQGGESGFYVAQGVERDALFAALREAHVSDKHIKHVLNFLNIRSPL